MDATPAPSEPQADDEDAPIVEDVTPAPTEPHADDADAPEVAEDGFETLLPQMGVTRELAKQVRTALLALAWDAHRSLALQGGRSF